MKSCKDCEHYNKEDISSQEGECRAHPPKVLLLGILPPQIAGGQPKPIARSFLPGVSDNFWCSEFNPKTQELKIPLPVLQRTDIIRVNDGISDGEN